MEITDHISITCSGLQAIPHSPPEVKSLLQAGGDTQNPLFHIRLHSKVITVGSGFFFFFCFFSFFCLRSSIQSIAVATLPKYIAPATLAPSYVSKLCDILE